MVVRPVRTEDKVEWVRMRAGLWPSCPRETHAQEIDEFFQDSERQAVFVCERPTGGLQGVVEVSVRDYAEGCDTSNVGYVEGWYVDPDVRRTGVGRVLVEAAENWAMSQGCREMASDTELDNETSYAAHVRLGYEETERLIQFRKDLPAPAAPPDPMIDVPEEFRRMHEIFYQAPFVADLGMTLSGVGRGWCETRLNVLPKHLQQDGFIHAGVQATMADHTGGCAGGSLLKAGEAVLTVEFKINLLRPAKGHAVRCKAVVLKPGRTITVSESEVFTFDGVEEKLTAKATVTLAKVSLQTQFER